MLLSDYRRERAAEKALEAEQKLRHQEKELQHQKMELKVVKEKASQEMESLDEQITDKKIDLAVQSALAVQKEKVLSELEDKVDATEAKFRIAEELYQNMANASGEVNLFDKVVDLKYENEQLKSQVQELKGLLNKAYEFMKSIVLGSRNMLDVFKEKVYEGKEWMRSKVGR